MDLNYKTSDERLNQRLAALINILELIFPERIRAYYLSGSALNGTMVKHSDLDVIAVFRGEFADGEADKLRMVRRDLTALSEVRYDIVPRCEAQLKREGVTGLKLATAFLYGDDLRDEIPLEPVAKFRHDVLHGFVYYARELRGHIDQLKYPLTCPDAADFYYGYTTFGNWDGTAYTAGTRIIINCITLGATARVLQETGERCTSKLEAVQRYQETIGGRWGEWLVEVFKLCKLEWEYDLPTTTAAQKKLQTLLGQMADYENAVLEAFRDILTAEADIPITWGSS